MNESEGLRNQRQSSLTNFVLRQKVHQAVLNLYHFISEVPGVGIKDFKAKSIEIEQAESLLFFDTRVMCLNE